MPYLKITNLEENHFGFQYKDGLNVDPKPFNPNPKMDWGEGGLYFTDEQHILDFLHHNGWVRVIEVPVDAKLLQVGAHWRADKVILKEKYALHEASTWEIMEKMGIDIQLNIEGIMEWVYKHANLSILKFLGQGNHLSQKMIEEYITLTLNYDKNVKNFIEIAFQQGVKKTIYISCKDAFNAYQKEFSDTKTIFIESALVYLFDLYKNLVLTSTNKIPEQWLIWAVDYHHPYILKDITYSAPLYLYPYRDMSVLLLTNEIYKDFLDSLPDKKLLESYFLAIYEGYLVEMQFLRDNYHIHKHEKYLQVRHTIVREAIEGAQLEILEDFIQNSLYKEISIINQLQFFFEKVEENNIDMAKQAIKMVDVTYYCYNGDDEFKQLQDILKVYIILINKVIKYPILEVLTYLLEKLLELEEDFEDFEYLYCEPAIINALIKYNKLNKQWLAFLIENKLGLSRHIDQLFEIASERNDTELMEYLLEIS